MERKNKIFTEKTKEEDKVLSTIRKTFFSALQLIFPLENLKKEFFVFKVDFSFSGIMDL